MMIRKITMIALITGIVIGVGASEGFNAYRHSQDNDRRFQDSQNFQQRVRCKAVADVYVKDKSTDLKEDPPNAVVLALDKVDYSPARNSCVAEVDTIRFFIGGGSDNKSVEDLLSGETLLSLPCNKDCVELLLKKEWIDPAFDYVMNNADRPITLERKYVQMQSELAPKATDPASSVAEPNDWQSVPASGKQDFYPDSGKPLPTPASQRKSAP